MRGDGSWGRRYGGGRLYVEDNSIRTGIQHRRQTGPACWPRISTGLSERRGIAPVETAEQLAGTIHEGLQGRGGWQQIKKTSPGRITWMSLLNAAGRGCGGRKPDQESCNSERRIPQVIAAARRSRCPSISRAARTPPAKPVHFGRSPFKPPGAQRRGFRGLRLFAVPYKVTHGQLERTPAYCWTENPLRVWRYPWKS